MLLPRSAVATPGAVVTVVVPVRMCNAGCVCVPAEALTGARKPANAPTIASAAKCRSPHLRIAVLPPWMFKRVGSRIVAHRAAALGPKVPTSDDHGPPGILSRTADQWG